MIQKTIRLRAGGIVTVHLHGDAAGDPSEALVVLPGVMSDARAWRQFAAHLRSWPRVAVVNRRGRRPSTELPAEHSLAVEIADLHELLDALGTRQIFGWSFGGLIALHAANERSVDHLIAYEPVMAPFGTAALPDLERAHAATDWDLAVEIINRQISGFDAEQVEQLRANPRAWDQLRRLAQPLYPEILAIATSSAPTEFARNADRIDVIIGEHNLGKSPYGASVDDVLGLTPRARTRLLPGQGHLAHLDDPGGLAAVVDSLS